MLYSVVKVLPGWVAMGDQNELEEEQIVNETKLL